MPYQFRQAICNEVFEKQPFPDVCKAIRRAGYSGIEIAPFTLSDDPAAIPTDKRREYRSVIESEGLQFVGLHWLLMAPKGLHVTTPDKALRQRSWQYLRKLIDLCADLGEGGIMVFGSPKQRSTTGGLSPAEATGHFIDGLAGVAPHAAQRGVAVLVEALPKEQCDVVLTLDEAVAIVRQIKSPGIRTMFDTHNAVDELDSHASLVERHFELIRHVHINEIDGRHPGTGSYDFKPVFEVLRRRVYRGWVSLEVFDFTAGAEKIAQDSLRYIETEISKLGS
jgi:sugar phosphate isomerase/epimerase